MTERLPFRFLKYVLYVNKFTSSMMVYGELGAVPLNVDIKLLMLKYWARLCLGDKHNISNTISSLLYTIDEKYWIKSEWIQTVKTTLNNCGFSGFLVNQTLLCSIEAFEQSVKLRLKDQFIQKWQESISGVRSQGLCDMRVCQFCKTDIGDEFHHLLCCVHFKEERRKYIEAEYYRGPSTIYL